MIGYAVIGTCDPAKATEFYDPLTALLGAKQIRMWDRGVFYGVTRFELAVLKPFDGNVPAPGNGNMVALEAPSRAAVDAAHALALKLGGTDEGQPGLRGREESHFYAAYFRDPEGNKLCAYRIGPA